MSQSLPALILIRPARRSMKLRGARLAGDVGINSQCLAYLGIESGAGSLLRSSPSAQSGEAWAHPFIAIYEPFGNGTNSVLQSAKLATTEISGDFLAVEVKHTDGTDLILNATGTNEIHRSAAAVFQGSYGVTSVRNNGDVILYLGSGKELFNGGVGLKFTSGEHSASVVASAKSREWTVRYSSEADFQLYLPDTTCSYGRKYR
ncbi:MAG: hypothetical protein M3O31_06490 [Acidobacteriota bacterium]|nr:hypothetical protein [Acidobacteriota bacterium]